MSNQYKRAFILLLILITTFVAVGSNFKEENKPSNWAEKEITAAIEKNIVPVELQSNYQQPIKRYEYGLLALRLLESTGKVITVKNPYPFNDINKHPNNRDIVLAYNAGLINGYTDGTFKPDEEITRQEVAKLLLNLITAINPEGQIIVENVTEFSDSSDIGKWALDAINYCYHNDIIKGTGKDKQGLDIISPNGKTSIEQSIAMIYRLGVAQNVFNKNNLGTIKLTVYENDIKTTQESSIINEFAVYLGKELALEVKALSQQENVEITAMGRETTYITIKDIGAISILRTENRVYIEGNTPNINFVEYMSIYRKLVGAVEKNPEFNSTLTDLIGQITIGNNNTVTSLVGELDRVTLYKDSDRTDENKINYKVVYTKELK